MIRDGGVVGYDKVLGRYRYTNRYSRELKRSGLKESIQEVGVFFSK